MNNEIIKSLIKIFEEFPGVGEKTAQKYTAFIIKSDKDFYKRFLQALINVKKRVFLCKKCFNFSQNILCGICSDKKRDKTTITIVEKEIDIDLIEATKIYNGVYFVLGGVLNPLDEKANKEIYQRIQALNKIVNENKTKKIVIAISTTVQGRYTYLKLNEELKKLSVQILKLPTGIPQGIDFSYLDEKTVKESFQNIILLKEV